MQVEYSKSKLSDFYKTSGNVDRIIEVLPEYIKRIINK